MRIELKSERDLLGLRKSGEILAAVLKILEREAKEGVPLSFFNELTKKLLKKAGAKPAFLKYRPEGARRAYPAAICTSINNQIVHGIPSDYILRNGDILKIDLGVDFKGYITDAALTVGIGNVNEMAKKLIAVTAKALDNAIKECKPGNFLGDIGWAIEKTVTENGFKVVSGLTGHGVGFRLHEEPSVYNYGQKGTGIKLSPGLVLAIEPMTSAGSGETKQAEDDSFFTRDGSLSAHFEKTVAITENGREVLTQF
ncbi:MAG: type I methionyl aminopeptidase [Patescibacteria group bacterium]